MSRTVDYILQKDDSILLDMLTEFQNKGLLAQEVIFSNAVASEARKELGPEWENKIKKIYPKYPRDRGEHLRFVHGIIGLFLYD